MLKSIKFRKLAKKLQSPKTKARQDAAIKLAYINDEQTIDLLINALSDEDGLVRYFAAIGLGNSQDQKALPAMLTTHQNEKEAWPRLWIGVQILQLGEVSVLESVFEDIRTVDESGIEDWDNHMMIVEALKGFGTEIEPFLISKQMDENEIIRWIISLALDTPEP